MKDIAKKLYLVLTGVCVIALIVFLIQLIVINSGEKDDDPGSFVSGGTPGGQSGEDPTGEDPTGSTEESTTDPGLAIPTIRPTPQGTRRELSIDPSNNEMLIVYSDDALFDFVENELDWRFDYKGSGNAVIEISFAFIPPQGAETGALTFLNNRTGGDVAEFQGTRAMVESSITAASAHAQIGGTTYEAWLYRLTGSDLALAFFISYEFIGQRDDLYAVLSSASIEQTQP